MCIMQKSRSLTEARQVELESTRPATQHLPLEEGKNARYWRSRIRARTGLARLLCTRMASSLLSGRHMTQPSF